jgi:sugar lactone lactonase YvrE
VDPEQLTDAPHHEGAPLEPSKGNFVRDPREMTPAERRRRVLLLTVLIVLLALLAYATYYFVRNRSLPELGFQSLEAELVPPSYIFSFSGNGANELQRPVGVAVAGDGRVFVVDFGHRKISVFSRTGRYLYSFARTVDGPLGNPVHLAIKDNEVWVTDRRLRQIYIFDLQGKPLRRFRARGETLSWTPLALSFDAVGALRVTDVGATDNHRAIFFSADGSRTAMFGGTVQVNKPDEALGMFMFPNGVAVAKNGDVFIADGNNRRIQVFSSTGRFRRVINTQGVPRGVAIDRQQRLYVADALAHRIDIYDLKGRQLTWFGEHGYGPGQFNFPNDIALDAGGRIYITDRDNNQVQVWGWPKAALPPLPRPGVPWWLCLTPLLLLPLLLLLRKVQVVVTPDFMEELIAVGEIKAVASRKRLRLVAPIEDREVYAGRVVDDVDLEKLIELSEHSEADAQALRNKLRCSERESILLALGSRARALGTEDQQLRWLATVAEVRVVDVKEFREIFLSGGNKEA